MSKADELVKLDALRQSGVLSKRSSTPRRQSCSEHRCHRRPLLPEGRRRCRLASLRPHLSPERLNDSAGVERSRWRRSARLRGIRRSACVLAGNVTEDR
jgi:hypothetical protein